nr:unnamed protein product [Brassica oleracea]
MRFVSSYFLKCMVVNHNHTFGLWCTRLYANHQLIAQYGGKTRWAMVFFFSVTTPFGIALGMVLQTVYSPTALIVVGVLNACSVGLLNYMALVDLLGADFLGPKLQGNMKLQTLAYVAVFQDAGGLSLMAKWA